ncbi:hypothetical protein ACLKMH_07665 [Psychromonas sp. KJ10-10]|uniref:hypothetical protein n=1 Tax=Psychromonas sp. KJ10-10 TaxID=3391823 RepID=UPI0039B69069
MGKPTGFLELGRELPGKLPVEERLKDNKEFVQMDEFGKKINDQASRCMDCGVPFVTAVVRSAILFLSSMMPFTVIVGRKHGKF